MPNNSHLTLQDRSYISVRLIQGTSFRQIALELDKDPGTISREVKQHRTMVESGSNGHCFNPCIHRRDCNKTFLCNTCLMRGKKCSNCIRCTKHCDEFEEEVCPNLLKPPYICGTCANKGRCSLRKAEYRPNTAEQEYKNTLSESRKGFAISLEELERINKIVSPRIKQGQSIHHVCENNRDDIMCSEKTVYNLLNAGAFDADRMDCPRIVRCRPRHKEPDKKIDRHCYENRTFDDFNQFICDNPGVPTVQMDSVIGRKGGKVLLTMLFPTCNLLLGFLRDSNTARSVLNIINDLDNMLGRDMFSKLFTTILTDRGSEFSDPKAIEFDENGEQRCLVFYCDPSSPYQKGEIEVAHELIRRVIPKGTSLDNFQQEDIDLMLSHINSYKREKLNNRSAYQMFSLLYGDELLHLLNIREIEPNDIVLSPKLLRK